MTGTLGLFSLVDLFQLLASSARTGRLGVDHPEGKAKVYFDNGRVVHAEFGANKGDEAIYALFADERGNFEFQIGLPAPDATVETATENLMLEAIRRLDESSRQSVLLPDDAVPLYTRNVPSASTLSLQPQEVAFLKQVNGRSTIAEIAEAFETDKDEVKRLVDRLVRAGVLKLRDKKPRTARLVTRLVRQPMPAGTVGVDKNILRNWERALGEMPHKVACRRPDGTVLLFAVTPVENVGPYLLVSMESLALADLSVNVALLVKPMLE